MVSILSIFIPDSLTIESKDKKIKTYKVGIIGRTAAIFRVNEIIIYHDEFGNSKEGKFIKDILTYMDTPQYLRKDTFPLTNNLRYVGVLPPLRTPHHPTGQPKVGELRQGLTLKSTKKGTIVNIGAKRLALCKEKLPIYKVYTFRIKKLGKRILVERDIPENVYWGYKVKYINKPIEKAIKMKKYDSIIATSRKGVPITFVLEEIENIIHNTHHLAILFGGPYKGLPTTLDREIDMKINTIPNQGTETVRTEEAVLATLSIFNMLQHKK